jgi:hypothetical protein
MARRVVLFVVGGVLLVIGVLAAIAGGALMAFFGSNDTLSSGVQPARRPSLAASGCALRPHRPEPGISSSWASAQRARWTAISTGSAMM